VPDRTNQPVNEAISSTGKISTDQRMASYATNAHYVSETGHNIPDVFWNFLQQRGLVRTERGYEESVISDWVFAFGLPLTEAYWVRARVGGVERDVLVQAFERRILTYTPDNPEAWRIEMGNVGQHYYLWRYGRRP
jgi:hypothetical protein